MFSYVKSLVAVGLALVSVIGAGLWFQSRSRVLWSLRKESRDLIAQTAEAKGVSAMLGGTQMRLEAVQKDIEEKAGRMTAKDQEGLQLVQAVVKAATESGMEMTAASEAARKDNIYQNDDIRGRLNMITYEISLKGTYGGLVKFFQNVASWELEKKIEALKISRKKSEVEAEMGSEIKVDFIISIFSIDT